MGNAAFFYHQEELSYRFHDEHPFNQQRLILTMDLLREAGALSSGVIRSFDPVQPAVLTQIHTEEYVRIVEALSVEHPDPKILALAGKYGLDTEDTPHFKGMHKAAARIAGGSVEAAAYVAEGQGRMALHLGGGLHHAFPNKAAGFCVYNDAAVAISCLIHRYGAKVLYVDTDVHHGDGVQLIFYTEPRAATYSIHETGKYLFPGTGFVHERGEAEGFGSVVNMPVEPYTEDGSWLECFGELLENAVSHYKPDIIVSQHGCDAHVYDPLSHVHCSMRIYREMPRLLLQASRRYCGGKWVALGGGGYDIWRVVPRAWSLLWLVMSEHPLSDELEQHPELPLPQGWLAKWSPKAPLELPATWLDGQNAWDPMPRREEIIQKNRHTKDLAKMYLG